MLKEKQKLISQIKMVLDACVIFASFFIAYFLSSAFREIYKLDIFTNARIIRTPGGTIREYLPILVLWILLWILVLSVNGMYRSFRTRSFREMVWIIIKAAFITVLSCGAVSFLLKVQFISRVVFGTFMVFSSIFLIVEKWFWVRAANYLNMKGYNINQMLVVGTSARAEAFCSMIDEHPEWGLRIIGLVDDEEERMGKEFFGYKVIGALKDIPNILRDMVVDVVVFIVPRRWLDRIQKSIAACELQGVKASVAADLFDLQIARARQVDMKGFPLIMFETTFGKEWQLFIKRAIDLSVAITVLAVLSPLMLFAALGIKLTSPGPIFFKQKRVSLNGRIFTLFKFRSMYQGAEKDKEALKHLNEMEGPVFKITDDPRITPFGRFLRKTSIDELPQLLNVLVGHISLVGPRPLPVEEVEKFELWERRRQSMRSGITCLWQISGRNKIGWQRWMKLDLFYIDHWSLWLDFKILFRTIPAVLLRRGAK